MDLPTPDVRLSDGEWWTVTVPGLFLVSSPELDGSMDAAMRWLRSFEEAWHDGRVRPELKDRMAGLAKFLARSDNLEVFEWLGSTPVRSPG